MKSEVLRPMPERFHSLVLAGDMPQAQAEMVEKGFTIKEIDHAFRLAFFAAIENNGWQRALNIVEFEQKTRETSFTLQLTSGNSCGWVLNLSDAEGLQIIATTKLLSIARTLFKRPSLNAIELHGILMGMMQDSGDMGAVVTNLRRMMLARATHLNMQCTEMRILLPQFVQDSEPHHEPALAAEPAVATP